MTEMLSGVERAAAEAMHATPARRQFNLVGDMGKVEEAAADTSEGRAYKGRYRRVWMIRHGERADEADRAGFRKRAATDGKFRHWDPELTEAGVKQAAAAGALLKEVLGTRHENGDVGAGTVDVVFASPLHRTVKTAEQVAMALDVPLVTVAGLSQCALAMRKKDVSKVEFLTHAELQAMNPLVKYHDHEIRVNEKFMPAVSRIVRQHSGTGDIVIVTHREGIRQLVTKRRVRTPYCVSAEFLVDTHNMTFELQKMRSI